MGPALKGPFLKGKRTFWKSRLCSKLTKSLAEDESFFIGTFVDKILLHKWKNSTSMSSNFSEPALSGPVLMWPGVKFWPSK